MILDIYIILLAPITFLIGSFIVKVAKEEKQIKKYVVDLPIITTSLALGFLLENIYLILIFSTISFLLLNLFKESTIKLIIINAALLAVGIVSNTEFIYLMTLLSTYSLGMNSYMKNKTYDLGIQTTFLTLSSLLFYACIILVI